MAFSQAVSGLNAAASNLDVIGNNIANSATNGFKGSTASFADMMAGSGAGLGVKLAGIQQNFNDGIVTATGRSTDLAISGNGFFRLENESGDVFYSRNGQFAKDKDGFLVNAQGLRVTGYPAREENGQMVVQNGAAPGAIKVPSDMMNPRATDSVNMSVNLDSNSPAINATQTPFSADNPDSFSFSAPMTTYDSLGNKHELQAYFVKRPLTAGSTETQWDVYTVDPDQPTTAAAAPLMNLKFNQQGQLSATSATTANFNLVGSKGAATTSVKLDLSGSVQQSMNKSNLNKYNQSGYAAGTFNSFSVETDGTIVAVYSNSQKQKLGQVVLANFASPEGLEPSGDNVWKETGKSGLPIVSTAGTGSLGSLTSGALEASNVDMGKELVSMIVAQRNYQSNAQTIKTQDQILQTLVSLR